MSNTKSEKIYAWIAAICFAVCGVYILGRDILGRDILFYIDIQFHSIRITSVLWCVVYIGFAVLLMIRKRNVGLVLVSALAAILDLYSLTKYFSVSELMFFLAYTLLTIVLMLNVISESSKSVGVTKILGYIPAGVFILACLVLWIKYDYFSDLSYTWRYIVFSLLEAAGMLFLGIWLNREMPVIENTVPQNQYTGVNPYATASQDSEVIGGADKLRIYKDLLDSGVITQEEFDAKKKQILGL